MRVRPFIHSAPNAVTTLSEIKRVNDWAGSSEFLGVYAYATQSGVAAFELSLGAEFWQNTATRWLFGIDYGRTQPKALNYLLKQPNTEVKVHDATRVLQRNGFTPVRDFHAKTMFTSNVNAERYAMIAGSGNFSSNGLRMSVEAGITLQASTINEFSRTIRRASSLAETLWEDAIPAEDIIEAYTESWNAAFLPAETVGEIAPDGDDLPAAFWIEAGYVTKNRGPGRAGNQIDLPRGMNRYFGFHAPDNQPINSIIVVTFLTPSGDEVARNLRLGNNHMEKITLPIPETHGFDQYDGKVLLFDRQGTNFEMTALEVDDFEKAFSHKLLDVKLMNSGRRYGCFCE